jgi:hypothetical protein
MMAADIYSKEGADARFLANTPEARSALADSTEVKTAIAGSVEPLVVAALADDPTIAAAASDAVDGEVADRGLVGTVPYDTPAGGPVWTMADADGNRIWPEAGPDGLPTARMAEWVRAKMSGPPTVEVPDSPYIAITINGDSLALFDQQTGQLAPPTADYWRKAITPAGADLAIATTPTAVRDSLVSISSGVVKYLLNVWYPGAFSSQVAQPFLTLPGTGKVEAEVRPVAEGAYGIAALLASGSYNAASTGVSEADARATCARLTSSLAYHHRATAGEADGWGGHEAPWSNFNTEPSWQAAAWAYIAGHAAWMTWADLDTTKQGYVRAMVEWEANRFLRWQVPYFKRGAQVITPGDSMFETIAWNTDILALALVMSPDHANSDRWMAKLVEMCVAASARPADSALATIVNGTRVVDIIGVGSNVNDDGTVTNHDVIHPDYIASVGDIWSAGLLFAKAGRKVPRACLFNGPLIYRSLIDVTFGSPPYAAPGGTVYQRSAGAPVGGIYYPEVSDWGDRPLVFGQLDVLAHILGMDQLSSVKAQIWAPLHLDRVTAMQARNTSGQIYQPGDTGYSTRAEPMASFQVGRALWAAGITTTNTRSSDAPPLILAAQNRAL